MTSGDCNGECGSWKLYSHCRVQNRVKKTRRSPRSAGVQGSRAARNISESRLPSRGVIHKDHHQPTGTLFTTASQSNDLPCGCTELLDEIFEADDTAVDAPVSNRTLNESRDGAVYGGSGEIDEAGVDIDDKTNTELDAGAARNIERIVVPVSLSEEFPSSNVSVLSDNSGNQPTSCREIKDFLIQALPEGLMNIFRAPCPISAAAYGRGPIEDPYGNSIYPGGSFTRSIYPAEDLNIDRMFPPRSDHTIGTEAGDQSTEGDSVDATMSNGTASDRPLLIPPRPPIPFIERTLKISPTEDMPDAGESEMPTTH
ncbi:uncharacterized protein DFL_003039 [Arthrobotrys flagrans]|uniref:Uncharacterized protein n=1 Tax=Arthrobotrys flagrans TaxID=97331 RepID=A0A437ACQ3_ARTFL|nr:hypothetical protein DFL_003039 [Arthrobotrys flagrans]